MQDVVTGLVGRERELAELGRLLSLATAGNPTVAVVEGDPGTGRTAVLDAFLAGLDEVRVLRSAGIPWEAGREGGVAAHLARGLVPAGTPVAPDRPWQEVLAELQADAPLVVAVDDADLGDPASVRALVSAVRWLHDERVLLVLVTSTGRGSTSPARRTIADLDAPRVRVTGLDARAVQMLAAARSGVHLPRQTAQLLRDHSAGNPRLLTEILDESGEDLAARMPSRLPAPRRVQAEVGEVLARCAPQARALVEAASVLPPLHTLVDAAELSEVPDAVAALDEAVATGLVLTTEHRGLPAVTFAAPVVRAAVYDQLGPAARQRLHRRAAGIVEDESEQLEHRVAACPGPDAALAAELAAFADRRASEGAWTEVADAMIKASRLSPDRAEREDRLLRGVDALVAVGDLPRAIAHASEVEGLRETAMRNAVLGYLAVLRGRPAEADSLLERAWDLCNPARHPDTAALVCQRRVLHSLCHWDGPGMLTWAGRARTLVGPPNPAAVESMAIMGLGLAACGDVSAARDTYAALRDQGPAGVQVQRFRMGQGWLDLAGDLPESARRELESAAPVGAAAGSLRIALWALAWLARTQFALGEWDEALQTVRRGALLLDQAELELLRPLVHWTGAQIHALRDEWGPAREHLAQTHADLHHYEVMSVPAHLARAQCAEAEPDYGAVVRALQPLTQLTGSGIHEPGFWPWHDVYANALVMTNQVDEASRFLIPHEELAADRGHRSSMARAGYVRGRIHGARGDLKAARQAFATALELIEELPLPYDRARVSFAFGQTLRRAGKRREADTRMNAARDLFEALGARAYVRRCDRELVAGGLTARRGSTGAGELTPQESAVATLVSAGLSNREVADELFVSVKTVQFHLTRIYAKLGLRSRSELAAQYRTDDSTRGEG